MGAALFAYIGGGFCDVFIDSCRRVGAYMNGFAMFLEGFLAPM
jgi:hypothetical protein